METDPARHLERQLLKIGGAEVGSADWLAARPELTDAARSVFEAGLARTVARELERDKETVA